MSRPSASGPTPESNARDIAALTSAVDMLVSQFIRPNAQQANANRETLDEVIELLGRHAEAIASVDLRLDRIAEGVAENSQQIAANTQQIAALGERIEQFDTRLEETRQLVAKNASDIAQASARHNREMAEIRSAQERNDQQIANNAEGLTRIEANIDRLVEENRAFRESQQSQLAAIIGNANRISRLEQQAS